VSIEQSSVLTPYLSSDAMVCFTKHDIPECAIPNPSPFLLANSYYFGHPEWAKTYFESCHRHEAFKERWIAATEGWDGKIVVDIGCGPGNLYAALGGQPKVLIGVDVSRGTLEMAARVGYIPILADAQNLPFIPGFADIVAVNATLHHCDDMEKALVEAARLVKSHGLLVVDHDPQLTAWNYKGLAMLFYRFRLLIYRVFLKRLHVPIEERKCALATETHHKPGDGVTPDLFRKTLEPMGFTVNLYPHNNTEGAAVLKGKFGRPPHWRYRLGQLLSGTNPYSSEAALSLMCIAQRN
jgi:ubiquinone/menaquinone biosynthesis C-methylase UbiE